MLAKDCVALIQQRYHIWKHRLALTFDYICNKLLSFSKTQMVSKWGEEETSYLAQLKFDGSTNLCKASGDVVLTFVLFFL